MPLEVSIAIVVWYVEMDDYTNHIKTIKSNAAILWYGRNGRKTQAIYIIRLEMDINICFIFNERNQRQKKFVKFFPYLIVSTCCY